MECETENSEPGNSKQPIIEKSEDLKQEHINDISNHVSETVIKENSGLTTPEDKQWNRRFTLRPRKCISKDLGNNLQKVMKKSLKNNVYLNHQHLETIFEEPIVTKQGKLVLIGLSKAKRSITFSQFVTKAKLKKRKMKTKKLREKLLAERKKMEDVESKLWKLGL